MKLVGVGRRIVGMFMSALMIVGILVGAISAPQKPTSASGSALDRHPGAPAMKLANIATPAGYTNPVPPAPNQDVTNVLSQPNAVCPTTVAGVLQMTKNEVGSCGGFLTATNNGDIVFQVDLGPYAEYFFSMTPTGVISLIMGSSNMAAYSNVCNVPPGNGLWPNGTPATSVYASWRNGCNVTSIMSLGNNLIVVEDKNVFMLPMTSGSWFGMSMQAGDLYWLVSNFQTNSCPSSGTSPTQLPGYYSPPVFDASGDMFLSAGIYGDCVFEVHPDGTFQLYGGYNTGTGDGISSLAIAPNGTLVGMSLTYTNATMAMVLKPNTGTGPSYPLCYSTSTLDGQAFTASNTFLGLCNSVGSNPVSGIYAGLKNQRLVSNWIPSDLAGGCLPRYGSLTIVGTTMYYQVHVGCTGGVPAIVISDTQNWPATQAAIHNASASIGSGGHNNKNIAATQCHCGDPIDLSTGAYTTQRTDISIPGVGGGLTSRLSYNSTLLSNDTTFGPGWSWNWSSHLTPSTSSIVYTGPTGNQTTFVPTGTQGTITSYAPMAPYINATLQYDSSTSEYTYKTPTITRIYDSSYRYVQRIDLNGYTTTITYPNTTTQVITGPSGRSLTVSLNSSGEVVSIATPDGHSVQFTYTGTDLTSVTDQAGNVTRYVYNSSQQIVEVVSPRFSGATIPSVPSSCSAVESATGATLMVYDNSGRVICQYDPQGNKTSFSYAAAVMANFTSSAIVTNPDGNQSAYYFNDGVMVDRIEGYGTADPAVWSYTYDPTTLGRTSVTDPYGYTTTYTYDSQGNRTSITDPAGNVTTWTYNNLGEVLTETLPQKYGSQQATITNTYDAAGNLLTTSEPIYGPSGTLLQTRTTSYTYGNSGQPGYPTAKTGPNGNTTDYIYDKYGDRISKTAAAVSDVSGQPAGYQPVTKWSYNINTGRVTNQMSPTYTAANPTATSCSTPAAGCTIYTYDADGHMLTQTDGNGNITTNTYDANGNLTSVTNGAGSTTSYTYDADNRQISKTVGVGSSGAATSHTTYNGNGQVASQISGSGSTTSYTYDVFGHRASKTGPDNNTTTYVYDALGNLLAQGDPGTNGCGPGVVEAGCTTRTYNNLNQLVSISYNSTSTPNVTGISYSVNGDKLSETTQLGSASPVTETWTYDSAGEMLSNTTVNGQLVVYYYDAAGHQTQITYPANNNEANVWYTYDADGQMQTVTTWNNLVDNFTYTPDGVLASITSQTSTGTPVTTTYSVDNADNVTHLAVAQGTAGIADLYTSYNGANQLVATSNSGITQDPMAYSYNALGQLSAATDTSTQISTPYAYDLAGNLTQQNGQTQTYDAAGRLCWSMAGAVNNPTCNTVPTGATTYTFNSLGERTSTTTGSATTTAGYNAALEMNSYGSATYTYDGNGLLATETAPGVSDKFTWDTSGSRPLLLSTGLSGSSYYVYGPGGMPIMQTSIDGSPIYYLVSDAQGNVRLRLNQNGSPDSINDYTPYGVRQQQPGSNNIGSVLAYGTGMTDPATGLIYLVNRWYDPATAQFLSVDPMVATTGQPYQYVAGDPLDAQDPLGLCGIFSCIGSFILQHQKGLEIGAGIVLGIAAAATGVGAVVEAGMAAGAEGAAAATALSTSSNLGVASVVMGAGATALDTKSCLSGDHVACVGTALGGIAALAGGAGWVGTFGLGNGWITAETLPDAALSGAGVFGAVMGVGASFLDGFYGLSQLASGGNCGA